MNEMDIQRILPDWTLSSTVWEREGEKYYMAEKVSGDVTKYSTVRAIWIPSTREEGERLREELGEEGYKAHLSALVKKKKNDFNFLRSYCGKPGFVNLREIYDISNSDDTAWLLVARYDYFIPLEEYIRENGLTVGALAKLALDVCCAIEQMKKDEKRHLNLTPSCIFYDGKGSFRIDGIDTDAIEGKKEYDRNDSSMMAFFPPETKTGMKLHARFDTYCLGLIVYTFLNDGKLPFEKEYGFEEAVRRRLAKEPIPEPSYNAGKLNEVIMKSCNIKYDDRQPSPYYMRLALEEVYNDIVREVKKVKTEGKK